MSLMNFGEAKRRIIEALLAENFELEDRSDKSKNLLSEQEISLEEAAAIVAKTRGNEATSSTHHFSPAITVWVFRPPGWYVKFYFTKNTVVISFHRSE